MLKISILILSEIDSSPVSTSPAPLAALVLLLLLIPVIYPLGVLIAKFCCFKNKSETLVQLYVFCFPMLTDAWRTLVSISCECCVCVCVSISYRTLFISCVLVGYCGVFWCCGCFRKGQNTCTYIRVDHYCSL